VNNSSYVGSGGLLSDSERRRSLSQDAGASTLSSSLVSQGAMCASGLAVLCSKEGAGALTCWTQ
jgi:hypothetical protein